MTDIQLIKVLQDEAFFWLEHRDNKLLSDLLLEAANRLEVYAMQNCNVSNMNSSEGHWIDDADSYICSNCGYSSNNPNKEICGPNRCPRCRCFLK